MRARNLRRLSIGDYVVWKANANAKTEQCGFICQLDGEMARMLVLLSDPDIINKHCSLQDVGLEISLEIRGRNREAVERGEIPTNILEWPLDVVVLWYATKNHVLNRGYYDLGAVVDLCRRVQRGKITNKGLKKSLVERVRSLQRAAAMNHRRRRRKFPRPKQRAELRPKRRTGGQTTTEGGVGWT